VKKAFIILLLFSYSVATMGATVHLHFCMNEYVGASLWHSTNSQCGKCGMKEDAKKKGCCKDEHKQYKLKTDHQKGNSTDVIQFVTNPFLLAPTANYVLQILDSNCLNNYCNYHPPPNIHNQNLQVLYCTFLI
jgi:hypothetical protein